MMKFSENVIGMPTLSTHVEISIQYNVIRQLMIDFKSFINHKLTMTNYNKTEYNKSYLTSKVHKPHK